MITKELPNVMNDRGYQQDAQNFAKKIMGGNGFISPCKDFNHFAEWMESALSKAYLYGAQSAIRVGYLLADKDWEETVGYYKQQIEELKKNNEA